MYHYSSIPVFNPLLWEYTTTQRTTIARYIYTYSTTSRLNDYPCSVDAITPIHFQQGYIIHYINITLNGYHHLNLNIPLLYIEAIRQPTQPFHKHAVPLTIRLHLHASLDCVLIINITLYIIISRYSCIIAQHTTTNILILPNVSHLICYT